MGMCASQARLDVLVSLRSDMELRAQQINNDREALLRAEENAMLKYTDKINNKKLTICTMNGTNGVDTYNGASGVSDIKRITILSDNDPQGIVDQKTGGTQEQRALNAHQLMYNYKEQGIRIVINNKEYYPWQGYDKGPEEGKNVGDRVDWMATPQSYCFKKFTNVPNMA